MPFKIPVERSIHSILGCQRPCTLPYPLMNLVGNISLPLGRCRSIPTHWWTTWATSACCLNVAGWSLPTDEPRGQRQPSSLQRAAEPDQRGAVDWQQAQLHGHLATVQLENDVRGRRHELQRRNYHRLQSSRGLDRSCVSTCTWLFAYVPSISNWHGLWFSWYLIVLFVRVSVYEELTGGTAQTGEYASTLEYLEVRGF